MRGHLRHFARHTRGLLTVALAAYLGCTQLACAGSGTGDEETRAGAAGAGARALGGGVAGQAAVGELDNAEPASPAAAGSSSLPGGCNDLQVSFEPQVPTVLLLIDRSGSMWDSGYGASPTRWQAVFDSVMAADTGLVPPLEREVRFGLITYTGDSDAHECPVLTEVAPALANYEPMKAVYDAASERPTFKAETPTGAGVRAAIDALEAVVVPPDEPTGPKVLVLITDGEPDSCATPDPQCGQDESIAAVQAAFAADISTFVIGISTDVGAAHLQDVANAGAGLPVRAPDEGFMNSCVNPGYAATSARYAAAGEAAGVAAVYQPADSASITSALREVIRGVRGCSFALHGEVDLTRAGHGTVLLDDADLAYEGADGWHMLDARTLELQGDACERVRLDASRLSISFPCEIVQVD